MLAYFCTMSSGVTQSITLESNIYSKVEQVYGKSVSGCF